MKRKAAVLLSGGLDSAVTLFFARKKGYECHALAFDYGQRHGRELRQAKRLASNAGAAFRLVKLSLPWKGSSLLDRDSRLPLNRSFEEIKKGIPSTYVPARNSIFLSMTASFAEAIGAQVIFIGAHFEDSSGYPDCRREYLEAFDKALRLGTRAGLENGLRVEAPLVGKTKKEIIELGKTLGVPFGLTWSCYTGGVKPCRECDSCVLRAKGFEEAGIEDPLLDNTDTHR